MGLLDDAIREHLELKRRAGADPGDVAQMEHDALGPVVRGEQPAEPVAADDQVDAPVGGEAGEPAADLVADGPAVEQLAEPQPEPEPQVDHLPLEPEPQVEHGGATQEFDVEAAHVAEHPAEPPAAAADQAARPAAEEGKSEDELLEKTPEFLEDTPEHDRLWFEQGPPQEFDFDK